MTTRPGKMMTITGSQNGHAVWVVIRANPLKAPLLEQLPKEGTNPAAYGEVMAYGIGEKNELRDAIITAYFDPKKRLNLL